MQYIFYKTYFHDFLRLLQFVVTRGNNFFIIQDLLVSCKKVKIKFSKTGAFSQFTSFGNSSLLWPKATIFQKAQSSQLFTSFGHHNLLWPKTTAFDKLQCLFMAFGHHNFLWQRPQHFINLRVYSRSTATTVCYGKHHNILKFTERLFTTFGTHNSLWPNTITFDSLL